MSPFLAWTGQPAETAIPEGDCFEVAHFTETERNRHYDLKVNVMILFNPKTQTFYRIIQEGTNGPTRRQYAHMR